MFNLFSKDLLLLFNSNEEMIKIGIPALKTIILSFVFVGSNFIIGIMFQATGDAIKSLLMTLLRQIIMLLPSAFIFSKAFGLNGVWFGYLFAEMICTIIFIPLSLSGVIKKFRSNGELIDKKIINKALL